MEVFMIKHIKPKDLAEIKKIDLLTYLSNYQPDRLKKISHDTYCIKDHQSLHISNGLWHWQSMGIGGRSALDFLMKVDNYSFLDAAEILLQKTKAKEPVYVAYSTKEENKKLHLPTPSSTNGKAICYLVERGIDEEIIQDCINNHVIYESKYINPNTKIIYTHVTFIGYDKQNHIPKYANIRSVENDFKGDVYGSDKRFCFSIQPHILSKELHIFESAIDTLSYATLLKMNGKDYRSIHLLSLGGVAIPRKDTTEDLKLPVALTQYLEDFPEIKSLVLHLDNDKAGRLSAKNIQKKLWHMDIKDCISRYGKDVNDELIVRLGKQIQSKNQQRMMQER